jgi:prolyl 4-hydroxylase
LVNSEKDDVNSDAIISSSDGDTKERTSQTPNDCIERVQKGECETNSDFMMSHCASECIHSSFATTISLNSKLLRQSDGTNEILDNNPVQVEIGVQQVIHPDHSEDSKMIKATLENILKTNSYMESFLSKAAQKFPTHNLGDVRDVVILADEEEEDDDDEEEEDDDDEEEDENHDDDDDDDDEEEEENHDDDDDDEEEEDDDEIDPDEMTNKLWHDLCVNYDPHCHSLAAAGKCLPPEDYNEDDPDLDDPSIIMYEFMMMNCAPACQTCDELLDYEENVLKDCNYGQSTDIFQPGDLDRMFERIVEEAKDGTKAYTVNILSRPSNGTTTSDTQIENDNTPTYHNGPWILTIDNFLTDEECDRLIELGGIEEYKASGLAEEDDLTDEEWQEALKKEDRPRTSTNAWCQYECYEDPIAKQIISKIENLTGIPDDYQEWLQLVKYTPGQFYKTHHDNDYEFIYSPTGPRLLTVFMYLNDVEEGGATRFNNILGDDTMVNLDVYPRKGTALIWPSVLSKSPNDTLDTRTFHEAMVVQKGVKYGANAWLHLRDYKNSIDECDLTEFERVLKKRGISVKKVP